MRRLEIGPGPVKLGDDWDTVSVAPGPAVDLLCEWGIDRLPYPDGHFAEVYASHVIEHVPWTRVPAALMEVRRVTGPGGVIEVHTVDFEALVTLYSAPATDRAAMMNEIAYRLFHVGSSRGDPQWHRSFFDRRHLSDLLSGCGFSDLVDAGEPRGEEKHGEFSFGVRGVKR